MRKRSACLAVSAALRLSGQMGGGWLVSADIAGLGWRNAFFINVPICLVVLGF